jgi:hypothetical protein
MRKTLAFLIAWCLGFRQFQYRLNSEQFVWAKSQQEADDIRIGEPVNVLLPAWIKWLGKLE